MDQNNKSKDCVDFRNGVEIVFGVSVFKPNDTVPGKILAKTKREYAALANTYEEARRSLEDAALKTFANAIIDLHTESSQGEVIVIGKFAVFAVPIPEGDLSPVTSHFDFVPNLEQDVPERVYLSDEELLEDYEKGVVRTPEGLFATLDEAMEGSIVKNFLEITGREQTDESEERPVFV